MPLFLGKSQIQNNFTISIPKAVRDELEKKIKKEIKPGMIFIWKKEGNVLIFEITEQIEVK